jgi:hypothetical protein
MISFFESFLANNIKFGSLNEVITFINNVITEDRTFNDKLILDRDITLEEAFFKVMSTCGYDRWIPTEKELFIVWEIMMGLKQEDWNRLYYKNNLYDFADNKTITNALVYVLEKMEAPFLDPNSPPKEIKVEMDELLELFKEYVYYSYQIIDRLDRIENMIRDVAIIADTDSSIISLDAWYRFLLDKTYDKPMKIKRMILNPIEFVSGNEYGEPALMKVIEHVPEELDYDFYSDEVVEMQRLIKPISIIPQDALRYSIINIIAYILGQLILDYMKRYTMNSNSYSQDRKCLLVAKNEFLFKRVLITNGKKNYADIQEMQEGHMVPKAEGLKIMGMPIDKATLQETTRKKLKEILYEDILNSDEIDQIQIMKDIAKLEKEMYNALLKGSKDYYKPTTVKSMANYENPMGIQGIKASLVYNELRDEGTEAINLEERNGVDIIKVIIDRKSVEKIRLSFPDKYNKAVALMDKYKEFSCGIDAIALPINVAVPDWLLEFVDYKTIINDNLKNFPLESVGLYRLGNDKVNYSNILKV